MPLGAVDRELLGTRGHASASRGEPMCSIVACVWFLFVVVVFVVFELLSAARKKQSLRVGLYVPSR